MRRKNWQRLHENFVFRFLAGHLITLLVALAVCSFGLSRSYDIVRADIQEAAQFSLSQGVVAIDHHLEALSSHGLQTILDSNMPKLAAMVDQNGSDFYLAAYEEISRYNQTMLYLPSSLSGQGFCYLLGTDRFIYRRSVYDRDTFMYPMKTWGLAETELQQMIADAVAVPHFFAAANGDLYLLFNFMVPGSSGEKTGMTVYRVSSGDMLKYLGFLNNYEGYRLAIYDKSNGLLWTRDAAGVAEPMPATWGEAQSIQNEEYLILRSDGERTTGLHYLLLTAAAAGDAQTVEPEVSGQPADPDRLASESRGFIVPFHQ